jgi:hypothetical protein
VTDKNERKKQLMRYAAFAGQFSVSIGLGVFLGLKADKFIKLSFPLFVWLLPLLAIFGVMYSIINETSKKK